MNNNFFKRKSLISKAFFIIGHLYFFTLIAIVLFIVFLIVWYMIPYKNYDSFIKENFLNSYIKNTEKILTYQNNFSKNFLTDLEEKELLKKSHCDIKSFSYKKIKNPYYNNNHQELEINFSCKNGIWGTVSQHIDNGNNYHVRRYIYVHKKHSTCRIDFIDNPHPEDKAFCWTSRRIELSH